MVILLNSVIPEAVLKLLKLFILFFFSSRFSQIFDKFRMDHRKNRYENRLMKAKFYKNIVTK